MKPVGGLVHLRHGTVHLGLVRWLCLGSVPAAFCGVLLAKALGNSAEVDRFIQKALGVALLVAAAGLVARAYMRLVERARRRDLGPSGEPASLPPPPIVIRPVPTVVVGALGGVVVGLTSVGSGSLIRRPPTAGSPAPYSRRMHLRGTPDAATHDPEAAGPPPDAPHVRPDPSVIAEARLRLTGMTSRSITLPAGSELNASALRCGWAVLEDDEGVPFAALEVDGSRPGPGPAAEQILTGQLAPLREGGESAGPFAELRLVPDRSRWAGAEAIITRDPLDLPTLASATPQVPLLLVVLDGPRRQPGPPVATVIRSVLALAERVGSQRTAPVGVLILPAPEYGDERDAALAEEIAAALGVRLVLPSRPANRRLLLAALDGQARLPDADWPAESLSAWRSWRLPRDRRGLVLMFTGLSGSGKSTVARAVVDTIAEEGDRAATLLDGDVVRRLLSAGLGYSPADRDLNILRIGFVAAEIARHSGIAVCAPIAPFAATRARVRAMAEEYGDFVLVHVATPLDECERRDRKGLYLRARAGEIADFTGISSPYEPPDDADLVLDTSAMSVATASDAVLALLRRGGWLPSRPDPE